MTAMAMTPPTTPPAMAPVGLEDFEEDDEDDEEVEFAEIAMGVAPCAVGDVWVDDWVDDWVVEVAFVVVLDVEDCAAPVVAVGLTLVVWPFLAIQTPEPVLQHSFALEPTPQQ